MNIFEFLVLPFIVIFFFFRNIFTTVKPKYRYNHNTNQPELISQGYTKSDGIGLLLCLGWVVFGFFCIMSLF